MVYLVVGVPFSSSLSHHGIKGQKWGVRNGPSYPLEQNVRRDLLTIKEKN